MTPRRANRRPRSARGVTLIEAAISIVLVGMLLAAALQTVGMSRKGQKIMADRARGQALALDLMNEILTQDYAAPSATRIFGIEVGKLTTNRSQFTDVDDYNGWTESPPTDKNGNALAGMTGWRRTVTVQWADPATWAATSQADTGLKLITVTTTNRTGGGPVATVKAYRSVAWVDTIPTPTDSNHTPTATLIASKTSDVGGRLTTTLDASTSTDRDSDTLSYSWNFGDGTTGSGATVTHSYNAVGTYTATLTAYDGRGGVASSTVVLTVSP